MLEYDLVIKDTHRGLWYEDGKLTKVLKAGRYKIPRRRRWFQELPKIECVLVDMRERDLTIKGQEILTADKVAIRVSILVQFCGWRHSASWAATPTPESTSVWNETACESVPWTTSVKIRKTQRTADRVTCP